MRCINHSQTSSITNNPHEQQQQAAESERAYMHADLAARRAVLWRCVWDRIRWLIAYAAEHITATSDRWHYGTCWCRSTCTCSETLWSLDGLHDYWRVWSIVDEYVYDRVR